MSSNTTVATVDNGGIVTGVAAGTADITYTDSNGCQDTETVTVNANPMISGTTDVCIGATTTLSGTNTPDATTPWMSSNTTVATVDNSGIVTGVAAGTADITYTDSNGCQDTETVTVNANPMISGTTDVCIGATTTLSGTNTPDATTPWMSSNTTVATVTNSGVVTGVAAGTADITYTDSNGCQDTETVTVNANPTVAPETGIICIGGTIDLNGYPGGGSGTYTTHTWAIDQLRGVNGIVLTNTGMQTVTIDASNATITDTNLGLIDLEYSVTDDKGCSSSQTITVEVRELSNLTVMQLCNNGSSYDLQICFDYANEGSSGQFDVEVAGTNVGTYNYSALDANGCILVSSTTFDPSDMEANVLVTVSDADGAGVSPTFSEPACGVSTTFNEEACCTAEVGSVSFGGLLCPDEDLVIDINNYEDYDAHSTYIILTDESNIVQDIIDVSEPLPVEVAGSLSNTDSNPATNNSTAYTIAYDYWGLQAGDEGLTYNIYVYNENDIDQPNPMPLIGNSIIGIGAIDDQCFALVYGGKIEVPAPLSGEQQINNWEGDGGTSPFNYNNHQITVEGGTDPFKYTWETDGYVRHAVVGDGELNILYADNASWSVTVTDANGCTSDLLVFTNDPLIEGSEGKILDIYDYSITPSINSAANGSIDISVEGGTQPYTYQWSGPSGFTANTEDVFGLVSGWYSVTVTDVGNPQQHTIGWYWVPNITSTSGGGIRGKVGSIASLNVYPNPFTAEANIEFELSESRWTNVAVYSLDGRKVQTIFEGEVKAGESKSLIFDAANIPAGVYILQLKDANGNAETSKILLAE